MDAAERSGDHLITLPNEDIELDLLLEAIRRVCDHDFRQYSKASLKRRLHLALSNFGLPSISHIQSKLMLDKNFFFELLQYLTVPVTEMFRDPGYFAAIRENVIPHLRTYPSVKVWIAGCSTGEEAYSFAILLEEEGLIEKSVIYATDINPTSLKKAQAGIYSIGDVQKFTQNYQRSGGTRPFTDYYSAAYNAVALEPRLRKRILFTDHSLSTDSAFSEFNYISCRNVMIYFERPLQDRAIGIFSDSLGNGAFLGLGEKESLRFSTHVNRFENWIPEKRIYRKKYENDNRA